MEKLHFMDSAGLTILSPQRVRQTRRSSRVILTMGVAQHLNVYSTMFDSNKNNAYNDKHK